MADDRSALLRLSAARIGASTGTTPDPADAKSSLGGVTTGLVLAAVVVGILVLSSAGENAAGSGSSAGFGTGPGWYAVGYKEANYQRLATFQGPFESRSQATMAANAIDPPFFAQVKFLRGKPS